MKTKRSADAVAFRTRARCKKVPKQSTSPHPGQPPATRRRAQTQRKRASIASWEAPGENQPSPSELAVVNTNHVSDEEVASTGRREQPARQPLQSAAATTTSDSDVVIVSERNARPTAEDEEKDDDVVISEPPQKRARTGADPVGAGVKENAPAPGAAGAPPTETDLDDDADVRIVGVVGQVATRDLPHPRPDCAEHRFKLGATDANSRFCDQCYCYVCDVKASECQFWGTGRRDRDHANAHCGFAPWIHLRKSARAGNKDLVRKEFDASGPLQMPPRQQPVQPLIALDLDLGLGGAYPFGPGDALLTGGHPGGSGQPRECDVDAFLVSIAQLVTRLGDVQRASVVAAGALAGAVGAAGGSGTAPQVPVVGSAPQPHAWAPLVQPPPGAAVGLHPMPPLVPVAGTVGLTGLVAEPVPATAVTVRAGMDRRSRHDHKHHNRAPQSQPQPQSQPLPQTAHMPTWLTASSAAQTYQPPTYQMQMPWYAPAPAAPPGLPLPLPPPGPPPLLPPPGPQATAPMTFGAGHYHVPPPLPMAPQAGAHPAAGSRSTAVQQPGGTGTRPKALAPGQRAPLAGQQGSGSQTMGGSSLGRSGGKRYAY